MAAKALEADFDKWQKAHGAKSDLVWLEMSEKGRTINFLLEGMDEFTLRFPEVYPPQNDSHRFVRPPRSPLSRPDAQRQSMTVQARSLANWATEVNKMLATGTPMHIGDILTRSLALKKEVQTKSKVSALHSSHPLNFNPPLLAIRKEGPQVRHGGRDH